MTKDRITCYFFFFLLDKAVVLVTPNEQPLELSFFMTVFGLPRLLSAA